ncbi:MAG TPA: MFS transporter [Acidimicrobiales bacterium]|jgi:EmrB/QacA subfamily drug resistance transporter
MERKWWTLIVVCAATFMLLLDVTIVIVALPEIQSGLHSTFADVQWVIDAYAITLASLLLTAGSLADRYGRRLLFLIGLAVFTVGSALCGAAQSPLMLIVSRSLQGVGGAILFATSLALLAQTFHGRERGVAFGIWGAVTGVATSLGPVLGGLITTGISWRGIFFVNLPVGVVALAIAAYKVDESRQPDASRPDWAGFVVLTAGLVSLTYGLIRAGESSWSSTAVITCLCLGAALIVTFIVVERRASHPMFDLSLFRIPTFVGGSIAAFTMNGSLFAMLVYLVLYLQDNLGYSALQTGLRLLLISGASLVFATISGRLSSQVPVRWLIGPGLFLVGIGLILMAGLTGTSSWTHFIPGFIISGIGAGLVNPPLASTAVGVVVPQRSGMASGVNTTFRQIGIATAIAVYGSIFTSAIRSHLDQQLASTPSLAGSGSRVTSALQQGTTSSLIAGTPGSDRGTLVAAIHSSFAATMNELVIVSGVVALVGAAFAVTLIRSRDFVEHRAPPSPTPSSDPAARSGAAPGVETGSATSAVATPNPPASG